MLQTPKPSQAEDKPYPTIKRKPQRFLLNNQEDFNKGATTQASVAGQEQGGSGWTRGRVRVLFATTLLTHSHWCAAPPKYEERRKGEGRQFFKRVCSVLVVGVTKYRWSSTEEGDGELRSPCHHHVREVLSPKKRR